MVLKVLFGRIEMLLLVEQHLIKLQRIKYSDFRLSSDIECCLSGGKKLFLGVP